MWIMEVCVAGWLMCGMLRQYEYESRADCVAERRQFIENSKPDSFKWIICKPKKREISDSK